MSIKIEHLRKRFGTFTAVDDVTLDIREGELLALLGPSGSGKTTLLRVIAGLEQPDGGRVLFDGEDATSLSVQARRAGFVFQHYALFRHLTVEENVAFGLRVRRGKQRVADAVIRARVAELLSLVQLDGLGGRYPAQLSGGQRQRVALARALAIEPRVLLLDEPFGALDAQVRRDLRRWLRELHDRTGLTTIFVTHDQEEALAMSDRIGVMKSGRLEQVGTPSEIYRDSVSSYVADFVGAANTVEIDAPGAAPGMVTVRLGGHALSARVPAPLAGSRAVLIARPEDIALSPQGTGGANSVQGTVSRRQYLGGKTHYLIGIGQDVALAVETHGDGHDRYMPGADVELSFDPAKTLVLAS